MAELVYVLCALTSGACAWLLVRSFLHHRSRILLWSSLCFAGQGVTNVLLFVDRVMLGDDIDLGMLRATVTLASMLVLVFGLIWDVR